MKFYGDFTIQENQNYDLNFDYIVNDLECEGSLSFQFYIDQENSLRKEIFNSEFKNTQESKKWESQSICFRAPFADYSVMIYK